ncbi:MAG: RNA polymerase [Rhodobacteraceae bacterium]|nr:RNA polymerase [Paracoccaceae bacterium]
MRADRGRLLAALTSALGDFDLAEEALSEAQISALTHWQRTGAPDNPQGWLLRTARRKAIDRLRRTKNQQRYAREMAVLQDEQLWEGGAAEAEIPDQRLRLIFTCCHPALGLKSQVALTLRSLGGLSTGEIARAFLDKETAMGQRLSRAKTKIREAGIRFALPGPADLPERLNSVLAVIYLIFNEGYAVTSGESPVRQDLCEEALYLARLLRGLCPDQPEVLGLLALILTSHARRPARMGDGFVALAAQDRGRWDRSMIAEGLAALDEALTYLAPGPYQIKAAISALPVQAPDHAQTDWRQVLLLYSTLAQIEPTPVVHLNRLVALAETGAVTQAATQCADLADALDGYQPFHAAFADLLERSGQTAEADMQYERAIALAGTKAQAVFLQAKRQAALG